MSYLEELKSGYIACRARLSQRRPEAGPQRVRASWRIVMVVNGRQIVLKELPAMPPEPPAPPSPPPPKSFKRQKLTQVIDAVSRAFEVPIDIMLSHRRHKSIIIPRQVAMFLAYEMTGLSLPQIGRSIGGRNHTTLMYGCNKVRQLLQSDPDFALRLESLRAELTHAGGGPGPSTLAAFITG
jgi:hypothetical protein